jgi:ABC-type multidrug transport system ATPase subunit
MIDVSIRNISKSYYKGEVQALRDISFDVNKGELFGLIGPDGAGKTTLFRILTTLLLADKGEAIINGSNIISHYKDIRKKIGYMPGKFSLYQDLTVEENLNFFAAIFNTSVSENYDLIKDIYVQLEPFKTRRAGKLSGGMKQKLALCCALIHRPEVLFLDEPTTGVDTVSRKEFWMMLKRLKEEGITILVSTPYMDEAKLCERIALIQKGQTLSINTPQDIVRAFPDPLFAIRSKHMSRLLTDLRADQKIKSVHSFGEYHHFTVTEAYGQETIDESFFNLSNHEHLEIQKITPTVEDCFIYLMTKNSDESN